ERAGAALKAETFQPWTSAATALRDEPVRIDRDICGIGGFKVAEDLFIDFPHSNPVKEDPEVWVSDATDPDAIHRVNRYFDAEQLSNAYRDVKQVAWIFSDGPTRENVC